MSGGVPCGGSGGKDSAIGGVMGCMVVYGTKGSEGHLSFPACVDFGGFLSTVNYTITTKKVLNIQ